jgi:hypothetical protein
VSPPDQKSAQRLKVKIMATSNISAVATGPKKCKPFLLEVMVSPPQGSFKFELTVEKGCTPDNDPIWKLVFDLYKKVNNQFTQIVHVSFKAGSATEKQGIKSIAVDGITEKATDVATKEVMPVAQQLDGQPATPAINAQLKQGMSKIATVQLEGDED